MRLIQAKCPSCGANIEVDSNRQTVTCSFCRSNIIVDDAIAKFRIELLGSIKVDNLPNIDSYLILADRYYKSKEYDEAYIEYSKALDLQPNNYLSIIRRGICDSLTSNYIKTGVSQILNAIKESSYLVLDDNDKLNEISRESIEGVKIIQDYFVNIFENEILSLKELLDFELKIIDCILCYKYINHITKDNQIKKDVLKEQIKLCDILIKKRKYQLSNKIENFNQNRSIEKYIYNLRNDAVKKYNEISEEKLKTKRIPLHIFENSLVRYALFVLISCLLILFLTLIIIK